MSGQIRYSDEFKIDAVAQVTERGYSVKDVAERLGISIVDVLVSRQSPEHRLPKQPVKTIDAFSFSGHN